MKSNEHPILLLETNQRNNAVTNQRNNAVIAVLHPTVRIRYSILLLGKKLSGYVDMKKIHLNTIKFRNIRFNFDCCIDTSGLTDDHFCRFHILFLSIELFSL